MRPRVSILIPCYNAGQWIQQAIESSLGQTYENKEVIVIDDGSTDNSLSVIRSFGDAVRWESGFNNGGNAARNRLLELSTGEWLQYLDADDYLLTDKVERQVQLLNHKPEADIIYSPSIMEYHQPDKIYQEVLPIPEPRDDWILLARWFLPQTGSPLWRKQAIMDAGCWKINQPCCQEHELYLRLLKANKNFTYCPGTSSVYRQWSESTVCKKDKSEVFRQRLKIEDKIESHLKKHCLLTVERQNAINQARFECARKIWMTDKVWANQLIRQINNRDRRFRPEGAAAPKMYQFAYKTFGFGTSEWLGYFRRRVKEEFKQWFALFKLSATH